MRIFLLISVLGFILLELVFPSYANAQYVGRVDTGSSATYTDILGNLWSSDRAYSAGSYGYVGTTYIASTTSPIANTSDDSLYQRSRRGTTAGSWEYRFDLPSGTYDVKLLFAEIYSTCFLVGCRVFDVSMEGALVLDNFDIYATAGANTAVDRTFTTTVLDGQLNINFTASSGSAAVTAIEVLEQAGSPDTIPPAAITNLASSNPTYNSATLSWTSPGDDGTSGTATSYDVRYSTASITEANWATAILATGEPTPAVSGTSQSMVVSGLNAETLYYFSMKAIDNASNVSDLSNVVSATTLTAPPYSQRVDTGSSATYTDTLGNLWSSDRAYSAGSFGYVGTTYIASTTSPIANTSDDSLYQNSRRGSSLGSWEYRFDLPNGNYNVRLLFAEIYSTCFTIGCRVFDVSMEGVLALDNFDIYATAGANTAVDRTFTTTVSDGQLNINFVASAGAAAVLGIEVVTAQPDFTFAATPSSRTLGLNSTVDYIVEVGFVNGFTSTSIDVWVTGLPTGVTGVYEPDPMPHQGKSFLTLTSSSTAAVGTYTITLGATSEGITHTQGVALVVTDQPEFTISGSPNTQSVTAGNSVNFDVFLTSINGFNSGVNLSVSGLPSDTTFSFNPNPATPSATSIMTVTTTSMTPSGTFTLTITGTSGALEHSTPVDLIVALGRAWSVVGIGSTGAQNNSLKLGQARNDGVNRVYVGTIQTGRVMEFSWNGSSWGNPVDIGGSPLGREIHNFGIGIGRNDGVNRVYACSVDGELYEISWNGSVWSQTTVGSPNGVCLHALTGAGRNDGVSRLYAARGSSVNEYTWNGLGWDTVFIGNVSGGLAHGLGLGTGRGGATNYLYVASTASGTYEATYNGTSWILSSMGDTGDIVNVSVGTGRNDGVLRVYAPVRDTRQIREFTWNGSLWSRMETGSVAETLIHAYAIDGRNDGIVRLYASGGSGNAYEFTWNGVGWNSQLLGGGSGYLYGFHVGVGRNDGINRLYGGSYNQQVYEYAF